MFHAFESAACTRLSCTWGSHEWVRSSEVDVFPQLVKLVASLAHVLSLRLLKRFSLLLERQLWWILGQPLILQLLLLVVSLLRSHACTSVHRRRATTVNALLIALLSWCSAKHGCILIWQVLHEWLLILVIAAWVSPWCLGWVIGVLLLLLLVFECNHFSVQRWNVLLLLIFGLRQQLQGIGSSSRLAL